MFPLLSGSLSFHRGPLPGEPSQATFLDVEGAHVRFVDDGHGPAVVMLHGFASSLETWDSVAPSLRQSYRVLTLDLKGFGWTDRPEGDYSPQAQALLVQRVMDRRDVGRADIVAHSWGASVALALALGAPERVRSITLFDAWVYEEQLPLFFHWARNPGLGEALFFQWYGERARERLSLAFHDPRFVTDELIHNVERAFERPGTRAAALATVRGQRFLHLQPRYRLIRQPVLLLWGREDRVSPVSVADRLMRDLPQARLIVYPRCGHFPMIEAAKQVSLDLKDTLAARR